MFFNIWPLLKHEKIWKKLISLILIKIENTKQEVYFKCKIKIKTGHIFQV